MPRGEQPCVRGLTWLPPRTADSDRGHRQGTAPGGSGGSRPHLGPPNCRAQGDQGSLGLARASRWCSGVKGAGNGAGKEEGGAGVWMSLGVTRVGLGGLCLLAAPTAARGGEEDAVGCTQHPWRGKIPFRSNDPISPDPALPGEGQGWVTASGTGCCCPPGTGSAWPGDTTARARHHSISRVPVS